MGEFQLASSNYHRAANQQKYIGVKKFLKTNMYRYYVCKVEKIEEDSLDLIPSPSSSVKIEIMGRKVCLRFKGKILLGDVNKFFTSSKLSRQ